MMKHYFLAAFLLLQATLASAQGKRQDIAPQKHNNIPQHAPVKRPKADAPATAMPVVKPDTARIEKMPVVKPPANIHPK